MNDLLNDLIGGFVGEQVDNFGTLNDGSGFANTVFSFANKISTVSVTMTDILKNVFAFFIGVAIALIVFNALKKGYVTYILEKGDSEQSPTTLFVNTFLALFVATLSGEIYKFYAEFSLLLCKEIQLIFNPKLSIGSILASKVFTSINALGGLVVLICWIMLWWQSIKRGVELLVLRATLPLAACGLLNNDNGVFGQYVKKFIAITFTTALQVALYELGDLLLNSSLHWLWGVAVLCTAISGPKLLNELLAPMGGGTGMSKLQSSLMIANSLRGIFGK